MSDINSTNTFFILNVQKDSDDVVFVMISSTGNYIKPHKRSVRLMVLGTIVIDVIKDWGKIYIARHLMNTL